MLAYISEIQNGVRSSIVLVQNTTHILDRESELHLPPMPPKPLQNCEPS